MTASMSLVGVSKRYGDVVALHPVDLTVRPGEFLTLLGPSGSGKTTLLMTVAGFTSPTTGDVLLDGRSIAHLPPEKRGFGVVFQGYALFPHLSVAENVAFPLRVRGRPRGEITTAVERALDLTKLRALADRLPRQLSGGQQQRVALSRALVFSPSLLLLDEPLSALDKALRLELQAELKELHERVGKTFVLVTHDQEEALSLSDRVAIMREGRLEQVGAPQELYVRPASAFVATFLGKNNLLRGRVTGVADGVATIEASGLTVRQAVPKDFSATTITIALRPEKLVLEPATPPGRNAVGGRVARTFFLGQSWEIHVDCGAVGRLTLVHGGEQRPPEPGAAVIVSWTPEQGTVVADD